MKMPSAACLAATLLVSLAGCSTPSVSTRGQDVDHAGFHDHNVNTLPNHSGRVSSIQNHFHDQHAFPSEASYHSTSGFPGYNGFAGGGGACPSGGCPSGACPPGGCGDGHCGFGQPHHYHSYSYQRPQNLQYPDQNAVGGAVVYPYYTHKGPSDFFRKE